MLEEILPAEVECAESFADLPAPLYPQEAVLLKRSSARRRREFATVRACARNALGRLGLPPVPLPPGTGGAPCWPSGIVGSMTHCDGYRGAALARAAQVRTIGIDAEPAFPLPRGVLGLIASTWEREALSPLAAAYPSVCWDRLLFCAKEAVYKAWYPLTGQWLNFRDATVQIEADGSFRAAILAPGSTVDGFAGRWLSRDGLVLAAIAVLT